MKQRTPRYRKVLSLFGDNRKSAHDLGGTNREIPPAELPALADLQADTGTSGEFRHGHAPAASPKQTLNREGRGDDSREVPCIDWDGGLLFHPDGPLVLCCPESLSGRHSPGREVEGDEASLPVECRGGGQKEERLRGSAETGLLGDPAGPGAGDMGAVDTSDGVSWDTAGDCAASGTSVSSGVSDASVSAGQVAVPTYLPSDTVLPFSPLITKRGEKLCRRKGDTTGGANRLPESNPFSDAPLGLTPEEEAQLAEWLAGFPLGGTDRANEERGAGGEPRAGRGEAVSDIALLADPAQERIMSRFTMAVERRLRTLSSRPWTIRGGTFRRVEASAWTRLSRPAGVSFQLMPLGGTALLGVDEQLAHLLASRLLDRGPERRFSVSGKSRQHTMLSTVEQAVAVHCLGMFQLDLEWALAPLMDVESRRCRTLSPGEPVFEFQQGEVCLMLRTVVSDGESSGVLALLCPASLSHLLEVGIDSRLPRIALWAGDERVRAVCALSDEELVYTLSGAPLSFAAVVLEQLSEERRKWLFAAMDESVRDELMRSIGRRIPVLRRLNREQRMVARTLLMGEWHAARVVGMCTPQAAARFLATVASLPSLFPSQAADVLAEEAPGISCSSGLMIDRGLVDRLLMRGVAPAMAYEVRRLLDGVGHAMPFDRLFDCDAATVAHLLLPEPVGVMALVLRHLLYRSPAFAAEVFGLLEAWSRPAVFERLLLPRLVDAEVVHVVEQALCDGVPLASGTENTAFSDSILMEWENAGGHAQGRCRGIKTLLASLSAPERTILVRRLGERGICVPDGA